MPSNDPGRGAGSSSWLFAGCGWLLAAAVLPAALALVAHPALALALGVLLGLMAWRMVAGPQRRIARQLREYLAGRYEAREGARGAGVTGELARSADALGERLLQQRDHTRTEHQQATTRL